MQRHVIFAPHVDDELIGCSSLLFKSACGDSKVIVAYCDPDNFHGKRGKEAQKAADKFKFRVEFRSQGEDLIEFCARVVESQSDEHNRDDLPDLPICWAPDDHFDAHPFHKQVGAIVFTYCRQFNVRYGTYTTNMNTPYTQELASDRATRKRDLLDMLYPSQKSLWKHEHKFFLFEGRAEWALDV